MKNVHMLTELKVFLSVQMMLLWTTTTTADTCSARTSFGVKVLPVNISLLLIVLAWRNTPKISLTNFNNL